MTTPDDIRAIMSPPLCRLDRLLVRTLALTLGALAVLPPILVLLALAS